MLSPVLVSALMFHPPLSMLPRLSVMYHRCLSVCYKRALLTLVLLVIRVLKEQWIRAKYERQKFTEAEKNFTYEEGECVCARTDMHTCTKTHWCYLSWNLQNHGRVIMCTCLYNPLLLCIFIVYISNVTLWVLMSSEVFVSPGWKQNLCRLLVTSFVLAS